jgi:hypothetical protein
MVIALAEDGRPNDRLDPSVAHDVAYAVRRLQVQLGNLESLVLRTPTSPARNALCDAQIHLTAAIDLLRRALIAPGP